MARVELSTTADVVRLRALEQTVERAHQRIGWPRFDVTLVGQLRFGSSQVAAASIGHRELIVRGRRLWVECERFLEMGHSLGIVSVRERHATGAEMRRRRTGLEAQRPIE